MSNFFSQTAPCSDDTGLSYPQEAPPLSPSERSYSSISGLVEPFKSQDCLCMAKTSKRAARAASKVLRNHRQDRPSKIAAGSALRQRRGRG